ncbi:hypothetical protein ACTJIJ_22645 [Niabella sp. 22666]|uniref:hypothetical protein n=1 Tax=Niabella sp. 22666 TaxID=3453954 RepID=UPI003F87DD5F
MSKMSFFLLAVIGFQSCNTSKPRQEDIVGIWIANGGAKLQFEKNGRFHAFNIPMETMFDVLPHYSGNGSWTLKSKQDYWIVELNFLESKELSGGYGQQLLITGSKGILDNKPPWLLNIVIGDPDEMNRHTFKKQ